MSATVIRDFLVSLGYQVNKSSEQTFNDSLKKTAENAVKLGLAIEAAAAAVTGAVVKIAQGMEQSYYQSKRLGSSVKDINAISYALSQVGGDADAAKQSMENIASFMRRLPGGKSYIQKLVGSDVDAGNVPAVMASLAKKLSAMPYATAKVQADFLGIDENTLQAMIRDGGKYYDEYQKLAKKAGVDQQKYAEDSKDLMVKVRSLGMSFDLLAAKINSALIAKAGPYIEKFKNWIDRNFDSITKTVTKVVDVIMLLSDRIGSFVTRAMEWYDKLDPKSRNLVNTITAVAGAIWLFNKAFGASPVGRILALAAAVGVLYDDYQRWKETGEKGLVDWDKWEPAIQSLMGALETISGWFKTLAGDGEGGIGGLQIAMAAFATYMATKWASSLLSTFGKVGLGWKLLAGYVAYDLMKTPEQRLQDMNDNAQWVDTNVNNSSWGKTWGRISNWGRQAVGLEPKHNPDGSTKGPTRYSFSGGGKEIGRALSSEQKKEMAAAIRASSERLGMTPEDMATIFSFETGGTMNPWQKGPTTKWGQHRGLIQWGVPQRKKYGVTEKSTITEQVQAVERYLIDAGFKPGMGLVDAYSAVNAGRVGRNNASDAAAGGTWGTVADKVQYQMETHKNALNRLEAAGKEEQKKQSSALAADIAQKVTSIPDISNRLDGPFAPGGIQATMPLLPDNIANNSTANMTLNVENKFMGNQSEKQVQSGIEKGGRVLLRNMQPAIR